MFESLIYDDDFLQFWFYDLLTDSFWYPILRLGKNQLDVLKEFILKSNIDTYARVEVVCAVSQLALHYPERRDEVIEWLRNIMHVFISSGPESGIIDSDQIGLMICEIISIRGEELLSEIEQLYELGYVSHGIAGSFSEIKTDISKKPRYDHKREPYTIFEYYDQLNGISVGSQTNSNNNFTPQQPQVPEIPPVTSSPKIGRNEPCWCGSGKKYKKCCLNK